MARLTKDEKKWLADLQEVLDRCPSKRLGFYTIGDSDVTIFDKDLTDKYEHEHGDGRDFCQTVDRAGARLGEIIFPSGVASTAG